MSFKAKGPEEDAETKARREAAEQRADASRLDETKSQLQQDTLSVVRQFGRLSASGQRGSIGNFSQRRPGATPFNNRNIRTGGGAGGGLSIAGRSLQLR